MSDLAAPIRRTGGDIVYVDAWLTPTPGLIIHESIGDPGWIVTHEPSGLVVGMVNTKDEAIHLARDLGSCGDWTQPAHKIRGSEMELRARMTVVLHDADNFVGT